MQRDIKPGIFETISNVFIGTFNLNEWTNFKLDTHFPFLLSDIVIKRGSTVITSYSIHYTKLYDGERPDGCHHQWRQNRRAVKVESLEDLSIPTLDESSRR